MTIDRRSLRSSSRDPRSTDSPAPSTPISTRASTPTQARASASTPTPASKPRGRGRKSEGPSTPISRGVSTTSTATAEGMTPRRSSRRGAALELEVEVPVHVSPGGDPDRVARGDLLPPLPDTPDFELSDVLGGLSSSQGGAAKSSHSVEADYSASAAVNAIAGGSASGPALEGELTPSRARREASPRGEGSTPKKSSDKATAHDEPHGSSSNSDSDEEDDDDDASSSTSNSSDEDDHLSSDDESSRSDLLSIALASLRAKEAEAKMAAEAEAEKARLEKEKAGGGFEDDIMLLDVDADTSEGSKNKRKERPIPGLQIPTLPYHPLKLHLAGPEPTRSQLKKTQLASTASASASTSTADSATRHKRPEDSAGASGDANGLGGMLGGLARAHGFVGKGKGKMEEMELDAGEFVKELTRREKAKMPRTQSSAAEWASLPTIPSSLLPQMKRDYQALNLGNSLDPKRFMKGGRGKEASGKVPESFGIGTMINPPRHLQTSTLPRERAYVPGSIVSALVGEQEVSGYAKRKFGELQEKKMANGRGNGWKKRRT